MLNHSIFVFIVGWVIWFVIDKHPASLGTVVPGELGSLVDNFQLAFDMLIAGYLQASYVFIWKAHYIVLSLLGGLVTSMMFRAISNVMRRRKLHQVMWPEKPATEKSSKGSESIESDSGSQS
jgi:hypothetical protein